MIKQLGIIVALGTLFSLHAMEEKEDLNQALIKAVSDRDQEKVKSLLELRANPDYVSKYGTCTALTLAVSTNQADVVEKLLNAGADLNKQNIVGATPLIIAASRGYKEIVKILLDAKADPNIKDDWERTALKRAKKENHTEIATLLINYGAK